MTKNQLSQILCYGASSSNRYALATFLSIFISVLASAQSGQEIYYQQWVDKAQKLTLEGNFSESLKITNAVAEIFPDRLDNLVLDCYNHINLKDIPNAR